VNNFINTAATDLAEARTVGLNQLTPQPFPILAFGDTSKKKLFFANNGTIESWSGSIDYSVRVSIGSVNWAPFGGTYALSCGTTTPAFRAAANAAELQTALNLLTGIIVSGGVDVTGTFPNFLIAYRAVGVVATPITSDATLLVPDSAVALNVITAGSISDRQLTSLTLRAQPISVQEDWSPISSPYGGWSGTITTNTEGGYALLQETGVRIGEYVQAKTILQIEVSDPEGNWTTYLQTPAILRAKNVDALSLIPPPLSNYLTAAQIASIYVAKIATIAALRALAVTPAPVPPRLVLGYYAAGDKGGGIFIYDTNSVADDNGGTVIAPDGGEGRWLRLLDSSPLTPEQFGAIGDGRADDTEVLQTLLTVAQDEARGVWLSREYRITTGVVLNSSCVVTWGEGSRIIFDGTGTFPYNHAIIVESKVAAIVEKPIDGGTPIYDTTVVNMTSGELSNFTVGDDVFVWYGVDTYDPNQPWYGYFTTIASKDSSSIILTDGFPEASSIRRLRYTNISGGTFAAGDVITQEGASATIAFPHPGSGGISLLSVENVSGTFTTGTITNGVATATLVPSYDTSSSVDAQYAVTVRKLSKVAQNVVLQNPRIDHTFGDGVVGSGAVCFNIARNSAIRNLYTPRNVVGVALFYTHGMLIENLRCDELVSTSYASAAAVHGWNQVNTTVINLDAVTDAALVNLESQCRTISFLGVRGRRIAGGTGGLVISVALGCTGVLFTNTKLDQNVATVVLRTVPDGSQDTDIRFVNFALLGSYNAGLPLNRIEGSLTMFFDGTLQYFRSIKREIRRLALAPSVATTLQLPRGPYGRCRIYFSTNTGITGVSLVGTGGSENGQGENISTLPPPVGGGWATALAFQAPSAANQGISRKQLTITADGTLPSQSFVLVDFVCWNNDSTEMTAFNLGLGVGDGILSGSGSPGGIAAQPRFLGDTYLDYSGDKFWKSNGTTGSSWIAIN
jgi:hypothetical protein